MIAPEHIRPFVIRHMLNGIPRAKIASILHLCHEAVFAAYPRNEGDDIRAGRMVNIGGILAKRCAECGVTKELHRFALKSGALSGCDSRCDSCREARGGSNK